MQAPGLRQGLLPLALEFTPLAGPPDPPGCLCATQHPGGWEGSIGDLELLGPALAMGHQDEMVASVFAQAFVCE